jgi:hypothetical protein
MSSLRDFQHVSKLAWPTQCEPKQVQCRVHAPCHVGTLTAALQFSMLYSQLYLEPGNSVHCSPSRL